MAVSEHSFLTPMVLWASARGCLTGGVYVYIYITEKMIGRRVVVVATAAAAAADCC